MAQDGFGGGTPHFSIAGVIGTSLSVFSRNLVPFFVLALVIGLPYIGISLGLMSSLDAETIERIKQTGQVPSGFWGMVIVGSLIYLLTYVVTQSVIIYGTFQDLRGQKAAFGDCLARGFAVLPRVLIAAILASIAITIGWILLFVPAIILILMWWVFVPVLVIEGAGIIECFGRSRGLTRGHRWGILGLLVIVFIAQWLVGLVVGLLGAALGTVAGEILNFIVMLLFTGFGGVLVAVGYYYLRAEKEGIIIDDLAKVFD